MARGNSRGGYQKPARPAAVSGPGALSERTDGGPGDRQPVRVPSGGRYGDAQALERQQKGAPLPDRTHTPPSTNGSTPSPAAIPPGEVAPDVFAPTDRPGESPLAGAVGTGAAPPPDPEAIIRLIYAAYPHPQLLKLMRRR